MEFSTLVFIVYFCSTILLVLILSIWSYNKSSWKTKSSFFKAVLSIKSVYGSAIVHLYDTATDLAILINWGILAHHEISNMKQYENVNMISFLIPSIILIFIYRVVYAIHHYFILEMSQYYKKMDTILILLDIYIFKLIYQSFSAKIPEPSFTQKLLQLYECAFESMPQLVLQTIFLIRTHNTELAESGSIIIVFLSIIASILSIVTKYTWQDRTWCVDNAARASLRYNSCPCISPLYILRVLWRFCELIVRFSIFALLWSVLGGLFLPIYLLTSFIFHFILDYCTIIKIYYWSRSPKSTKCSIIAWQIILSLLSMVGIPLRKCIKTNVFRFIDNGIMLGIIWLFSLYHMKCDICTDGSEMNIFENPYINVLLLMGSICFVLEIMFYYTMYCKDIIKSKAHVLGLGKDDKNKIHPDMFEYHENRKKDPTVPGSISMPHTTNGQSRTDNLECVTELNDSNCK